MTIFRHDTPKRGDGNRVINGGEESGGVIAKASKSEGKRDKRQSLGVWLLGGQEGQRRRRDVMRRSCVGKKQREERGIFSGPFEIIEERPSAGVCVCVCVRVGERRRGGKDQEGDLVLGQVWFPLDQRPGVGLFVQAERPRGDQRQPDVAPPYPAAIEGESATALCSFSSTPPLFLHPCPPSPFVHPFTPPTLIGTKSKRVF